MSASLGGMLWARWAGTHTAHRCISPYRQEVEGGRGAGLGLNAAAKGHQVRLEVAAAGLGSRTMHESWDQTLDAW